MLVRSPKSKFNPISLLSRPKSSSVAGTCWAKPPFGRLQPQSSKLLLHTNIHRQSFSCSSTKLPPPFLPQNQLPLQPQFQLILTKTSHYIYAPHWVRASA